MATRTLRRDDNNENVKQGGVQRALGSLRSMEDEEEEEIKRSDLDDRFH